jgi:hypothetical protein
MVVLGALSVAAGRVEIGWTINDETQRLQLTWTEKRRPRGRCAYPAKLRYPHDRVAWTAAEWQGSARLPARRVRLYAGRATQFADGEGVTRYP